MNSFFDITNTTLIEKMNAGEMPPQFIDRYKIASARDPRVKNITQVLQQIVEEILSANKESIYRDYGIKTDQFKVRLFLSLEDGVNAFTLPKLNYPAIVIHLDTLVQAGSLDEIVGVLAHETHHNLLPKATHTHHQGQLGECACDVWSATAMRNAGYQIRGLVDFYKRQQSNDENVFSTHPAMHTRIIQVNNTEVALDKTYGKKQLTEVPLAEKPLSIMENLPIFWHADEIDRVLDENGFNKTENNTDRFAIFLKCLKEEKFAVPSSDALYQKQLLIRRFIKIIEHLQPINESDNPTYFKQLLELRDWLINTKYEETPYKNAVFHQACDRWILTNSLRKEDHLEKLKYNLYQFSLLKNYNNPEDTTTKYNKILFIAKNMLDIINTHYTADTNSYLSALIQANSTSNFHPIWQSQILELNDKESLVPNWDQAVKFALREYQENNTTFIASALFAVGIEYDPRLRHLKDKLLHHKAIDRTWSYEYRHLVTDQEGHIINPYALPRIKLEESLIATINWDELHKPPVGVGFEEFVHKYEHYLKLSIHTIPFPDPRNGIGFDKYIKRSNPILSANTKSNYAFFQAFVQHLQTLSAEEIQTIKTTKQFDEFFSVAGRSGPALNLNSPHVEFILNKDFAMQFFSDEKEWRRHRNIVMLNVTLDRKTMDKLYANKDIPNHNFKTITELKEYCQTLDITLAFEQRIIRYEALKFLKENAGNIQLQDLDFYDTILAGDPNKDGYAVSDILTAAYDNSLSDIVADKKKEFAENIVRNNYQRLDEKRLSENIEIYKKLNQSMSVLGYGNTAYCSGKVAYFTSHFSEQQEFLNKFCDDFSEIKLESSKKVLLLEQLIFKSMSSQQLKVYVPLTHAKDPNIMTTVQFNYNERFQDPVIRKKIIANYVEALVSTCPVDNDMQIKTIVDRVLQNCSYSMANEILEQFADGIVAQQAIAFYIKIQLNFKAKSEMQDDYVSLDMLFRVINSASEQPKAREEVLNFLLTPFDVSSSDSLSDLITQEGILKMNTENREDVRSRARIMHRQFWDLDPRARAVLIQKLVYAKNTNETRSREEINQDARDYVLNRVLPAPDFNETEERKVVNAYLKASTEAEQSVVISMMLASQEPQEEMNKAVKTSNGQMLKIVLDNLGPAGTKMAQAINSHPATPEDIRKDTEKSKSMANKPNRWELFDLIEECYGGKAKSIVHVGAILGAGAYGITAEIEKNNGELSALTLLRSYAAEKAKTEFDTLGRAAHFLVKEDARYEPVINMVNQANASSDAETDMDLALQQNSIAEALYNSTSIQIGTNKADTYTFQTATWIGHGERYKETAIVPGQHFQDLPEFTAGEKAEKRKIAMAILTVELHNILSGKSFDHDRHGAQQRINGKCIGQFDFGGVSLTPPTREQKWLRGQVIGRIMRDVEKGADLLGSLQKVLNDTEIAKTVTDKEFLASIERAVLALNEYTKSVTREDMISIFAAVRKTMSKNVSNSLGSNLVGKGNTISYLFSGTALSALDKKLKAENITPITINQVKPESKAKISKSIFGGNKQQVIPIEPKKSKPSRP